jgi:hypothetical protein
VPGVATIVRIHGVLTMSPRRLSTLIYALAHPLAIVVALGASIAGFLFLVFPDTFAIGATALGEWLPDGFVPVWAAIYCAGGSFVAYGIFAGRPNIEAAGFVLLGCALAISAFAVFAVRGFNTGLVAGTTIGPCAGGCLIRALILAVVEPRLTAKLRAYEL